MVASGTYFYELFHGPSVDAVNTTHLCVKAILPDQLCIICGVVVEVDQLPTPSLVVQVISSYKLQTRQVTHPTLGQGNICRQKRCISKHWKMG